MPLYTYKCCLCGYTEDRQESIKSFGTPDFCPKCQACGRENRRFPSFQRQISTGVQGLVRGSKNPCK